APPCSRSQAGTVAAADTYGRGVERRFTTFLFDVILLSPSESDGTSGTGAARGRRVVSPARTDGRGGRRGRDARRPPPRGADACGPRARAGPRPRAAAPSPRSPDAGPGPPPASNGRGRSGRPRCARPPAGPGPPPPRAR